METLPMFPLGLVAFPGSVIPLRLFEPRYLSMHRDLLDGSGEFGIVLIERGVAEAEGGEHFSVGSIVRVVATSGLEDDSIMIVAVGTERMRVRSWLPDDPYPKAEIDRLPEPVIDDALPALVDDCRMRLTKALALASELGADIGDVQPDLSGDPVAAMYEIARIAPIQEIDQQRILEAERASDGATILREELDGVIAVLEMQLSGE